MSVNYTERLGRAKTASDFTRQRGLCTIPWAYYVVVKPDDDYVFAPYDPAIAHRLRQHWRVVLNRTDAVIGVVWRVKMEPPSWGITRPLLLAHFNGGGGDVSSLTPPPQCWDQS